MSDRLSSRLSAWIWSFLQVRGLERPFGQPLYRYRCSVEELRALESALRYEMEQTTAAKIPKPVGPALCLFAAEWWRRHHEGGPWSWAGIKEAAGIERYLEYQMYPALAAGLEFWRRPLIRDARGRLFLVTLACEGGLPLKLVHRQNARLGAYFRQLLEDIDALGGRGYSTEELAAGRARILPPSLRQDVVFRLAGDLADRILELQAIVGDSRTPVRTLDEQQPDWRDSLPLVVEDTTARNLLTKMVEDAATIRRQAPVRIRFERSLVKTTAGWQLVGKLRLPSRLTEEQLSELMGESPAAPPTSAELYLGDPDRAGELVATVTRLYGGDEAAYRLESAPHGVRRRFDAEAGREQPFYLATSKMSQGPLSFPGSVELGELPWVFAKDDDYRIVGQGSVSTSRPVVVVALPENCQEDEELPELGTCCGRRLVQVDGEACFRSDAGDVVQVRTRQQHDHSFEYWAEGPIFEAACDSSPTYLGLPKIRRLATDGSGRRSTVRDTSIVWKPRSAKAGWSPLSDDCLGEVTLRVMNGETIDYQTIVRIVPSEMQLQLKPSSSLGEGSAILEGLRDAAVRVAPIEGVDVHVRQRGRDCVDLEVRPSRSGDPTGPRRRHLPSFPLTLPIAFRWLSGTSIDVELPYPARGSRFVDRDESVLRDESEIQVDDTGGVRAMAMSVGDERFVLEGMLLNRAASDTTGWLWHDLRKTATGRYELSLRTLREELQRLLAATPELDATVRLSIASDDKALRPCRLLVSRFSQTLNPDRDTGRVILIGPPPHPFRNAPQAAPEGGPRAVAIPLWDPGADEDELPFRGDGIWDFAPEERQSGPWLVLAFDGARCCARPLLWPVYPASASPVSDGGERSAIQTAVLVVDREQRTAAIDDAIAALAADPMSPDWATVEAFLGWLGRVPPSTFDVPVRLIGSPVAAVLALLRSESRTALALTSRALEELPFSWQLVNAAYWREAFHSWYQALLQVLEEIEDGESMARGQAMITLTRLAQELPQLRSLLAWISRSVLTEDPPFDDPYSVALTPSGQERLHMALTGQLQELNRRMEGRTWPQRFGPWTKRWLKDLRPIADRFLPRFRPEQVFPGWKVPVLVTPVAAALAVATGAPGINREPEVFDLRRIESFDEHWAYCAYEYTLALVLGHIQQDPSLQPEAWQ